jgi:hypothetical protein
MTCKCGHGWQEHDIVMGICMTRDCSCRDWRPVPRVVTAAFESDPLYLLALGAVATAAFFIGLAVGWWL